MSQSITKSRLINIDILRGFALLGVLLANLQSFTYPGSYLPPLVFADYNAVDRAFEGLIRMFAEGSFYPLFATLVRSRLRDTTAEARFYAYPVPQTFVGSFWLRPVTRHSRLGGRHLGFLRSTRLRSTPPSSQIKPHTVITYFRLPSLLLYRVLLCLQRTQNLLPPTSRQ